MIGVVIVCAVVGFVVINGAFRDLTQSWRQLPSTPTSPILSQVPVKSASVSAQKPHRKGVSGTRETDSSMNQSSSVTLAPAPPSSSSSSPSVMAGGSRRRKEEARRGSVEPPRERNSSPVPVSKSDQQPPTRRKSSLLGSSSQTHSPEPAEGMWKTALKKTKSMVDVRAGKRD